MYLITLLTYWEDLHYTLNISMKYMFKTEKLMFKYVCPFHHATNITKEIQHQYRESHKLGKKTIVAYYRATVYSKDT